MKTETQPPKWAMEAANALSDNLLDNATQERVASIISKHSPPCECAELVKATSDLLMNTEETMKGTTVRTKDLEALRAALAKHKEEK